MLLPILIVLGTPNIRPEFWGAFGVTVILNIVSQNVFIRAFKHSEASLVAPLRFLTPIFVILTAFLLLGEVPSAGGVAGIFLTVTGFLLLLFFENGSTPFRILNVIRGERGIILGLAGALLSAVSFPFDKQAVVSSSGLFASVLIMVGIGAGTILYVLVVKRQVAREFIRDLYLWRRPLLIITLLSAVGFSLTTAALNYSLAAYAASIKRLWSFWTILLAGKMLREKNVAARFVATFIMFLGIVVTLWFG